MTFFSARKFPNFFRSAACFHRIIQTYRPKRKTDIVSAGSQIGSPEPQSLELETWPQNIYSDLFFSSENLRLLPVVVREKDKSA